MRSLVKPVEFRQTLPVYFTACSGSYSSVCSSEPIKLVVHSFILNLDLKEIRQCLVHGRLYMYIYI